MNKLSALITLLLSSTVLASCSKEPTVQPSTAPPPPAAEPAPAENQDDLPGKNPNQAMVEIDPKIVALCDIPTPRFDFDSAALHDDTKTTLNALAACFVDGNAKDKNMRLVGHADPRGTEEYNMGLGQRRAASVAGYLEGAHLAQERMETSSRGELDATGTDEETWAKDRKVQIFLAE